MGGQRDVGRWQQRGISEDPCALPEEYEAGEVGQSSAEQ